MGRHVTAATQARQENRRRAVETLRLQGALSVREITRTLNEREAREASGAGRKPPRPHAFKTIHRDLVALRELWRQNHLEEAEHFVAEKVREFDKLRGILWLQLAAAQEAKDHRAVASLSGEIRALAEDQARRLGLDRPVKMDVNQQVMVDAVHTIRVEIAQDFRLGDET